jgi:hypothetical protein
VTSRTIRKAMAAGLAGGAALVILMLVRVVVFEFQGLWDVAMATFAGQVLELVGVAVRNLSGSRQGVISLAGAGALNFLVGGSLSAAAQAIDLRREPRSGAAIRWVIVVLLFTQVLAFIPLRAS